MAGQLVSENILVNAIAPGPYPSNMLGAAVNHDYSEIEKRNPRKRVGTPEDIAGLAIFLCSRAGSYTVGETITALVNGETYTFRLCRPDHKSGPFATPDVTYEVNAIYTEGITGSTTKSRLLVDRA